MRAGKRRRWRRLAVVLGGLAIGGPLATWASNAHIKRYSRPSVHREPRTIPQRQAAIVPGARVYADGQPSAVLEDRLRAARDLYRAGKVRRVVVSGDHGAPGYDEVNAMHRWLVDRGVASEDVFLDHAGLRTLDTMERAARVFRVDGAIVCTNEFHLERAVFLARRAGIDAHGLVADRRRYATARSLRLREVFARAGAFADSYLLGTEPAHLGPAIPIDGDAAQTHDRWTRR